MQHLGAPVPAPTPQPGLQIINQNKVSTFTICGPPILFLKIRAQETLCRSPEESKSHFQLKRLSEIFLPILDRDQGPDPAWWLSWLEHHPLHQKVGGSIPSRDIYLGCVLDLQSGCMWEATDECFFLTLMFLFLSPLPPARSKINKHIVR